MVDRASVRQWVETYESAWRSAGTESLTAIFAADASYLHSPYAEPVVGLRRIQTMWDEDRDGPDEVFTMSTEIVAVEGDTAVARAVVRYGDPVRQEYTNVWVLRFDTRNRCTWFEEWPYWPGRHWSAREPQETPGA